MSGVPAIAFWCVLQHACVASCDSESAGESAVDAMGLVSVNSVKSPGSWRLSAPTPADGILRHSCCAGMA
jgi:hypothetical protein